MREQLRGYTDTPVIHCAQSNPTRLVQGRKFNSNTPTMFGMKYIAPIYARASFSRAARCTPVQMVTISITPSTQPSRVVCKYVNPKDATMIWPWFVRLFTAIRIAG